MAMNKASQWHTVQADFSKGEITAKLMLRNDDIVRQSVAEMVNFMPNTAGSMERTPGTRYLQTVDTNEARIIPYLTVGNERSMVLLEHNRLQLFTNVAHTLQQTTMSVNDVIKALTTIRKQIVVNDEFRGGPDPWILFPGEIVQGNGDRRGCYWGPGAINMVPLVKDGNTSDDTSTVVGQANVAEATETLTIDFQLILNRLIPLESRFTATVTIRWNATNAIILQESINEDIASQGYIWNVRANKPVPGGPTTGLLDIEVKIQAFASSNGNSTPRFILDYFKIWADSQIDLAPSADLVTIYETADLPDIHFVQSPYGNKELVMVHPKYPPQWFFFDAGVTDVYIIEAIPFTGDTLPLWSINNYPSCVTSHHGRLVLAGGQEKPVLGSPIASFTETVWTTKVGDWTTFSDSGPLTPEDSVEFTSTFRSPIQWVYGQKTLLIGAMEMEYIASAEGIFSPGDLGVELHSTHGSAHVQPVSIGDGVLFAADGGRRVRLMHFKDESGAWLSQDASELNPYIFTEGIVRMVRLRNPHQMCLVLTANGVINALHMEGQLFGWSRMIFSNSNVVDLCVIADDDGIDIPYFLVKRTIEGVVQLHIEAIPGWASGVRWDFLGSSIAVNNEVETNVITGLDHLEGMRVQVTDGNQYLGMYVVSGGQITMLDQKGAAINVIFALVGLPNEARARLMPPAKNDPSAKARYSEVGIRTVFSTRPILNVVGQPDNRERPPERWPVTPMGTSEIEQVLDQSEYIKLNWDPINMLEIRENLPMRTEVIGVFGKLTENSI